MGSRTRHSRERTPRNRNEQHRGQWILLDAELNQLMMIGRQVYPMSGATSTLDYTARRHLRPVLAEAVTTRQPIDATVSSSGPPGWHLRAVPLLGPESGRPIAVLGLYDRPGVPVPAPPLVGTWEWQVTAPGPSQRLHTYASPAFYAVYGMPQRDGPQDSSSWQDEFVAIESRPATRAFFLGLLDADPTSVRFLDFTTATSTDTEQGLPLRCTGRRYESEDGNTSIGGLTFRRPFLEAHTSDMASLRATLTLSRDPLWLVDPSFEVIYASTDNLTTHEIHVPATRHLPTMCHPDDLPALRNLLTWVTGHPRQVSKPVQLRLATISDAGRGWRVLEFVAYASPVTTTFTTSFVAVWCRVSSP